MSGRRRRERLDIFAKIVQWYLCMSTVYSICGYVWYLWISYKVQGAYPESSITSYIFRFKYNELINVFCFKLSVFFIIVCFLNY